MSAIEWSKNNLSKKGWFVNYIDYERPSSGFKCINGGYICHLDVNNGIEYDQLTINVGEVFGSIDPCGIIMALYKDDFKKLINLIPNKHE